MDDRPPKAGKLRSDDGRLKAEGRGMCSEFSVQSSGNQRDDGRPLRSDDGRLKAEGIEQRAEGFLQRSVFRKS